MYSPNGGTIATGSADGNIYLWDAAANAQTLTLTGHEGWINAVAFSPSGATLASAADDGTIRLWNATTGAHIRTLTGHGDAVRAVIFSPNGNTIASCSLDGTIILWDAVSGEQSKTLIGHTDAILSIAFNTAGTMLASGGTGGDIFLWDVASGKHTHTLTGHTDYIRHVLFSPDDATLASASDDGTIRLWDPAFAEHKQTLTGHTDAIFSIAFSPDGSTLASGSLDNTVRLWDTISNQLEQTLRGHASEVLTVAFSPNSDTLVSGSIDGTALLWRFTPSSKTYARVGFSPSPVESPAIGGQITLALRITDGIAVAGYQATIRFDASALHYLESTNGDYLPSGAYPVRALVTENRVTLAATSLSGNATGSGTLANVTFEVVAPKASQLTLSDVLLTDSSGMASYARASIGQVTAPMLLAGDVNGDTVVNVQDLALVAANFKQTGENLADVNGDGIVNIVDLTLVAAAMADAAAAPTVWNRDSAIAFSRADIEQWLREARELALTDPTFQRGVFVLEQLLAMLVPKETTLLPNYPNPFNPETWIPYQLANPAEVTVCIYTTGGTVVRTLAIGHQPAGIYADRHRAAYWDGRNEAGEPVASGVYLYTLTAGDFTATRKMVIRK